MAETTRTDTGPVSSRGASAPVQSGKPAEKAGDDRDDRVAERTLADARELGTDLVAAVRETAAGVIDEQRRRAADEIDIFGKALRRSAESLDESGEHRFARYADDAAHRIDDFADAVRSRPSTADQVIWSRCCSS